jgi:mono/diheme cytochrome c family protein
MTVSAGLLTLAGWSPGAWPVAAPVLAQARPDLANSFESDPEAIARGEARFAERCTFCHGTRGRGAKGPCLTCGHWKFGGRNADIFASISGGRPGTQMGAFASSLTGEEIWQIIAFLRDQERKRRALGEIQ